MADYLVLENCDVCEEESFLETQAMGSFNRNTISTKGFLNSLLVLKALDPENSWDKSQIFLLVSFNLACLDGGSASSCDIQTFPREGTCDLPLVF